jgi:hypothetical protein
MTATESTHAHKIARLKRELLSFERAAVNAGATEKAELLNRAGDLRRDRMMRVRLAH